MEKGQEEMKDRMEKGQEEMKKGEVEMKTGLEKRVDQGQAEMKKGQEEMNQIQSHIESQVGEIKDHVNSCIGRIKEDGQSVKIEIGEVKGGVQRKIEEVEDKVQGKISSLKKRISELEIRSNNFPTCPELKCAIPTGAHLNPLHPLNFRMTAAIVMKVVSRYSKIAMHYCMRLLTAPPGENARVGVLISKMVQDRGKKSIIELWSIIDLVQKDTFGTLI
ncbi:hypothetical protein AVEN_194498-1 [Araneus ventricosus]|uniref:Uncharacterized protein n=1 Tax=Araneus ventricosus TaxID=182803 RepID=A0A4Y2A646_ARAVE|nr:hypothetical protein AVEN_194498-1 [Araneus ventricosus]